MNSKILLATTALALVLQPALAPVGQFNGNILAQTTTEISAEDAAKLKAEEQAAAEAEAANAAEAEAANAAEAEAAKQAENAAAAEAKAAEEVSAAEAKAVEQAEQAAAKAAEQENKAAAKAADAEAKAAEAEAKAAKKAEKEAAKAADAEAKAAKKAEEKAAKSAEQPAIKPKTKDTSDKVEATTEEPVKKEKKKKEAAEVEEVKPEAVTETAVEAPPTPSADAPVANEVAAEPIKEQIQKAEETATAVVPDKISESEKTELKAAETKRRKKAKDNREELIGAAAVGVAVGLLLPSLGGTVVEDQGDRFVVERDGEYYIRKDESALFRNNARDVEYEQLRGGRVLETIYRPNGSRVETIRDAGGYVLRRVKITPNGREVVLFDSRDVDDRRRVNYNETLAPIQLTIPRDEYIVSGGRYGRRSLAEIFAAEPVEQVTNQYSLREVRENVRVRDIVRRVDLDTIIFDSGSFTVRSSQVPYLADTAGAMIDEIEENPNAVFLIEGHTDAVGSDVYNLTLSDRRAETVARILVEAYDVQAENLVTEGYGEQYLKIDTEADERENRRVTIRNISPLLSAAK